MAYNDVSDQPLAYRAQDPGRRGLRGRQDDLHRRGERDRAADARRSSSPRPASASTTSTGVEHKTTTTVAMDFGRITLDPRASSSTCSARRGRTASGSCGTSCPTGRSARSSSPTPAVWRTASPRSTSSSSRGIGFIVAVNEFDGAFRYEPEEVRAALDLKPHVPVVLCDARTARSATSVLVAPDSGTCSRPPPSRRTR